MSKRLLAIDANRYGVNLALVDGECAYYATESNQRQHLTVIHKGIQDLCAASEISLGDLTELAVTIGPGAYTSVRVAVSIAEALAYAHQIPLNGVCSLHAWAYSAYESLELGQKPQRCALVMDARQGRYYIRMFEWSQGFLVPVSEPKKIEDLSEYSVDASIAIFGDVMVSNVHHVCDAGVRVTPKGLHKAAQCGTGLDVRIRY